jgi:hypothetical protein
MRTIKAISVLRLRSEKPWAFGLSAEKCTTAMTDPHGEFLSTDSPKLKPFGITQLDSRVIAIIQITEWDALNSHEAIWGKAMTFPPKPGALTS